MSRRTERIAEQLRSELARVLREESTDPRLSCVTLTRIDLAPDLSNASVFWSVLDVNGETDLDEVAEGLERASGFFRRQLARGLQLRKTPALLFRHDPSLALGSETLSLLKAIDHGEKT